ncbi:OLC1v1020865C2 [Oldenlandia corymbosa var. corymbosa]|uniref:OLC1v1020865C2 n=1 Tax=Oldenlandia corymbosa var. corymbosa TaxID=529605 RepID=A0AAV1BUE6_OLDCO|nr:OLC1v1020865C2 [Oldenlandia corymbosa var. corymbosa]
MSRAAALFTISATAFVLVVFFFQSTPHFQANRQNDQVAHIRRLGFQMMSPIFDPVMAKVQRIAEEKKSASFASAETELEEQEKKYFNDDGTLNLRLRLMVLFPVLDRSPKDGMLETKELEVWLTQQAIDRLYYKTLRALKFRDQDGDGSISFSDYFPDFTQQDIERNATGHGEPGWWMQQFRNADVDKSGTLSLYEFRDFLHPEDSRNDNIHRWLLTEKIRHIDENNDEILDLDEFTYGVYNTYKSYMEYESSGGGYIPTATELFAKLDLDKDKLLRVEELKPLFRYLCPGELVYAKHYAIFLIQEGDDNGDGKLSLEEMLNHEHIFFSAVYDNGKDDDDQIDGYHDEL